LNHLILLRANTGRRKANTVGRYFGKRITGRAKEGDRTCDHHDWRNHVGVLAVREHSRGSCIKRSIEWWEAHQYAKDDLREEKKIVVKFQ